MSEWAPSNAELDAAIAKCNSPEEIRELTKASLASQGIISRDRQDGNYGARVLRLPEQTSDTSLPAHGFKYEREFKYAPESGRRSLMLRANTLEDLQALEREMERTV